MKRPVAYVAGTGKGIPAKVMTNHDFAALGLETDHDWIVERTGIVERHIAGENETTCTMAADASRRAAPGDRPPWREAAGPAWRC